MSQLNCSASSRCLIFSSIISVLICQVVARHRFNQDNLLREQEMQHKTFENVTEELPKLLDLCVLKPSSIDRHKSEKLNQETPPSNADIKINTTCGRRNCENVPNYPLQLIEDLLEKQTPKITQKIIPASSDVEYEYIDEYEDTDEMRGSEDFEVARAISNSVVKSYDPSSWLYPDEYPDENNLRKNIQECKQLADRLTEEQNEKYKNINQDNEGICENKLKEIKPEETVDLKGTPVLIVNHKYSIIITGFECTAGVDCYDRGMSWGYKRHCVTNWDYRDLCALNNDETAIIQKRVAIAAGCKCKDEKIQ